MLQFSPCVYYRELWRSASPQGLGLAPMSIPSTPGRSRTARSTGAAPGLSIAYFLGNQAGPRLAQDVGPRASLAQHSPCLGRAGLGRTRDCPCCPHWGRGWWSWGWCGLLGYVGGPREAEQGQSGLVVLWGPWYIYLIVASHSPC